MGLFCGFPWSIILRGGRNLRAILIYGRDRLFGGSWLVRDGLCAK
jgi:hypothetical protein